jgi:hypothetical protein
MGGEGIEGTDGKKGWSADVAGECGVTEGVAGMYKIAGEEALACKEAGVPKDRGDEGDDTAELIT